MPNSGESAIDLRGRIARTSLPPSAGGMTTFAGTGVGCGAGLGVGVGLAGGVALRARDPSRTSGVELAAGSGGAPSVSRLAVGAELTAGGVVESLRSSGFLDAAFALDSLDSITGDGGRFLEDATPDDSGGVVFDLETVFGFGLGFASRRFAVSGLCVLRELSE